MSLHTYKEHRVQEKAMEARLKLGSRRKLQKVAFTENNHQNEKPPVK